MRPLVIANWKMNTTLADASVLATLVKNRLHNESRADVVLCPPYIWLQEVASILEVSAPHIYLGAQNCFAGEFGPYTGEVSAAMLKDLCSYCIVGHSERREHFHESSELVSEKVQVVLQNNMTPILCVGEKQKSENSFESVRVMLEQSLEGVGKDELPKIVIVYEPVWAISTNAGDAVATGDYANEICAKIKEIVGDETGVLYGGSVTPENAHEFAGQGSIDGVLVGGASLKANDFVEICKIVGES